jgi:heme exporter protein A
MLDVTDLTFGFGKKPLFRGLSFSVTPGQLIRVDGHNGTGKSTLISVICGLISGHTGDIRFADDDFRKWTSWIAPDANGLFPTLSAKANIEFWLQLRNQPLSTEVLQDCLNGWGISGEWLQLGLPVSKFSTGMKRRLALARLQLEKSKLWLIDEPLFGLDERASLKFKTQLIEHLQAGGGVVIVTHDARLVEGIKHQTVFLGGS